MEEECWKSKTSSEISQDKENINQGDCTIILLSTDHTEEKDIHRLLDMLARRKISSYHHYYCHRGHYQVSGKASPKLPKTGVIFQMTGFPINILMEMEFEKQVFLLDPGTNTVQSWKYKWIGENYEFQNNDNNDCDIYTLRIYPEKAPIQLMITSLKTIHERIKPDIQQHIPIPIQTTSPPERIKVKLRLTPSKSLQKKRTDELKRELKTYEDFVRRWERIDNPSLKKQEERFNALGNIINPLEYKYKEYQNRDRFSLIEGERLCIQAEDHISYLKSEIEMLTGKPSDGDQLICIPADPKKNYEFYDQIVKQPWAILKSIWFLPVAIQDIQCFLLRIGHEENDNPLFKYFMSVFKSKQKSSNIIYEFRPDTRWFQFDIQVWVPVDYTLEPYFFSYEEWDKKEAFLHLKEMVKSLWEEEREEYERFERHLETDSLTPLELVFIPPFGESKMKLEAPPGVVIMDKNKFYCLADYLKLVNDTQLKLVKDTQADYNYFENLYENSLKNVFNLFDEQDFLQNWLKKANPEKKRKFYDFKNFLSLEMNEFLDDDFQRHLFKIFDMEVLEQARQTIRKKTEETDKIVKNQIADMLNKKRRNLIHRVNMEFKDLQDYYQQWSDIFQTTRENFDKTEAAAKSALAIFKKRWREAKAKWTRLFNKSDQLSKIEIFFEKTEKSFKGLIKSLTLKLFYAIIILVTLGIMIFGTFWLMESTNIDNTVPVRESLNRDGGGPE